MGSDAVVLLNDVNLLLGPLCVLRHVTPLHSSYHVAADIKIFCNSTVLVQTDLGMMPPKLSSMPSKTLLIPCGVTLWRGCSRDAGIFSVDHAMPGACHARLLQERLSSCNPRMHESL